MKNSTILVILFSLPILIMTCKSPVPAKVSTTGETEEQFHQRMQWWDDAAFGMFIHWGVYSVPAGEYKGNEIEGIGEWIMDKADIPVGEYEEYAKQFNPVDFDAKKWVQVARDAGVRYIVITSKHHDGFSLWDSEVSDYNIVDFAPFGRDVLKELSDACAEAGITFCFYHSIMDWHHPDAKGENFPEYREKYLKPQLKELLTGYGRIGVLWFDGEWIDEWTEEQGKELYSYVRNLQPDIIINNRVGKGRQGMQGMNRDETSAGDFGTPEQEILDTKTTSYWESCMTMNDTWGFKKNDHNWKSAETLIHNLADIAAKGGNYLLNVGPDSKGNIPEPSVERLKEMGAWLKVNGEAIYGINTRDEYRQGESIRFTVSPDNQYLYAICLSWPGESSELQHVTPAEGSQINMLGYGQPLEWQSTGDGIKIMIPKELQDEANRPCRHAWVFKIKS